MTEYRRTWHPGATWFFYGEPGRASLGPKDMVTRWLHLDELGGDPWVLPIWAAANAAAQNGRCTPFPTAVFALGPFISIKLNVIARVVARVNEGSQELYRAAQGHDQSHVFTAGHQGYAFRVNNDLKYGLISDIDAFLFEVNSCAELIKDLVKGIFTHLGMPASDDEVRGAIRSAHATRRLAMRWFGLLDKNRNFVAHNGACYIAIDISDPARWELLVMKDNLIEFNDPAKFFTLSDLYSIAQGFVSAKGVLQEMLITALND